MAQVSQRHSSVVSLMPKGLPFTAHGFLAQEAPIYIFVAIVPVTMDAYFKLWIFRGLNRKNPAAAVTLKSMDRH